MATKMSMMPVSPMNPMIPEKKSENPSLPKRSFKGKFAGKAGDGAVHVLSVVASSNTDTVSE